MIIGWALAAWSAVSKATRWFSSTKVGQYVLALGVAALILFGAYRAGKNSGRQQAEIGGLKRDNDALKRMQEAGARAPTTLSGLLERLRRHTF